MAISVGIDLGTTFSAVAYIDPGTKMPTIIPNREGSRITPSVIQFLDGDVIFGSEAEGALAAGEPNCAATFKREIGVDAPYCYIDGEPYTSEQLSGLLLRHLKEDAEAYLGDTISDAVITVPAYFYSREREATINAAKAAGLKVKKIIDEPNAAALAYGLSNWRENAKILVYDLGGGTFDITLVHMGKNGQLSTVTTRGNHKLGGRDWDARIEDMLFDRFEEDTGLELRSDPDTSAMIRGLSEGVKKQLSAMTTAKVPLMIPGFGRSSAAITRQEFDDATSDLLEQTGALCHAVLDEAGLTVKDVTDVLLVGGSTRMPQVSVYLQKMFGKRPITHVNPDEAVALGAAIQSSKENENYVSLQVRIVDGKKITDRGKSNINSAIGVLPSRKLDGLSKITLRESTAHAMGIIAVGEDGTRYINDIIIPANHPRPVRYAKAFYVRTSAGNSSHDMEIFVLQGDKEAPLENEVAFRYVVSGIRHIPGQRNMTMVRVQYSYDANGIIHVSARQENDTVNLPIRREAIPNDMSRFVGAVAEKQVQPTANMNTNTLGLYSKWAGISNIPTTSRDRFGNPSGEEYDLALDGSFEGYSIYIINLCQAASATMNGAVAALRQKGFSVELTRDLPSPNELKRVLEDKCQLWIISQEQLHFTQEHYKVIKDFFEAGNGLYVWGDNDPLNTDANFIIGPLFSSSLCGNYYAREVLSIQDSPNSPGIIEDHLISTGLVSFFEGDSIAKVKISGGLEPLIYSSDSNVVTAYYDINGKRALVDGAFTRLWDGDWGQSAGTSRYIMNAAVWLANAERFYDKPSDAAAGGSNDSESREVETWDD